MENRELKRRLAMKKTAETLKRNLETEAKAAKELNEQIESHWKLEKDLKNKEGKPMAAYGGPHMVLEALKKQKERCENLIALRNKLIDEYQQEINYKDDEYVEDIKKQAAEVLLMIQRMSSQQKDIKRVCAEELRQLEEAQMQERSDILGSFLGEWEKLIEYRRQKEVNHLESYSKRADDHLQDMEELRTKDLEEFNWTKAKLETDVHVLTQQLQQMKATYQLNSEKLEYNFQVLKKRDEENNVAITTQKRKITRMNDLVNILRIKLAKQEKTYQKEYRQISEEYQRILSQFRDLRNKFSKFRSKDEHIYDELWQMNDEEVNELIQKLVTADRIIWEQLLEMKWECPAELQRIFRLPTRSKTSNKSDSASSLTKDEILKLLDSTFTKQFLILLVQEASDLFIDERLRQLLVSLSPDEQVLMKIDSVLRSIGIQSIDDVQKLEKYFMVKSNSQDEPVLISAEKVISVLNRFVTDHSKNMSTSNHVLEGTSTLPNAMSNGGSEDDPHEYWESLLKISSGSYFSTWDLLYSALMSYQQTLQERISLKNEVDNIENENNELKSLLQEYISSQVNLELCVPPTQQYAVKRLEAADVAKSAE